MDAYAENGFLYRLRKRKRETKREKKERGKIRRKRRRESEWETKGRKEALCSCTFLFALLGHDYDAGLPRWHQY